MNELEKPASQEVIMAAKVKTEVSETPNSDTGSAETTKTDTVFIKGKLCSYLETAESTPIKRETPGESRPVTAGGDDEEKGDNRDNKTHGQPGNMSKCYETKVDFSEDESDMDSDYDPLGRKASSSSESDPDYSPVKKRTKCKVEKLKQRLDRENSQDRPCQKCNETFKKNHNWINRDCTHKVYTCDMCQKKYKSETCLAKHKLLHTNKKPYSCDRCGKAFNDQSNMRRHRLSHDETSMSRQNIIHIEKPRYL